MRQIPFPVIDPVATGRNILRLRRERGMSVRDIQTWFNFEEPRAIYKWQTGQTLPSVDNLYALSVLLDVPMNSIIVSTLPIEEPQAIACGSSSTQTKPENAKITSNKEEFEVIFACIVSGICACGSLLAGVIASFCPCASCTQPRDDKPWR